jgi:hypothetical protein
MIFARRVLGKRYWGSFGGSGRHKPTVMAPCGFGEQRWDGFAQRARLGRVGIHNQQIANGPAAAPKNEEYAQASQQLVQ